ncbi:hypothetical protein EON65_36150, partial [archaeon]
MEEDTENVQQNFVLNNDQEGSFALLFDRRGQKSFDFQDWKSSSSMTMTAIPVLNAHLFTTSEDALLIYENSFGAGGGDDVNVLFKHADFKLACQVDTRINSIARITTYNGAFYLVRRINCAMSALTPQDHFVLTQAQRHITN